MLFSYVFSEGTTPHLHERSIGTFEALSHPHEWSPPMIPMQLRVNESASIVVRPGKPNVFVSDHAHRGPSRRAFDSQEPAVGLLR